MNRMKERGRLRVIEVSNSRQAWGAELAIMALASPLAARGIDLVLASPPGGDLVDQWCQLGLRHLPLDIPARQGIRASDGEAVAPTGQLIVELMATLRSLPRIARVAREGDIVSSSSLWTHFDCAVAGRWARRPVVLDVHDMVRPGTGRRVLAAAARLSSAVVANSRAVADCLGPAEVRNLRIMLPAVDLDRFVPGPVDPDMRRRLTSAESDPLVGIVGRVDPEKGVDVLVRAVSALAGPASRAHLVVVGSPGSDTGAYQKRLEEEADRLLGDRVRFVGRMTDVPRVLRALDVLVNASEAEPFGLSALEALATGVPVVATRSGGIVEFLRHGDNALLVPCGDSAALALALEQVIGDPALAARMAGRGREVAEMGHGVDAFADGLAELYRQLSGRTAPTVTARSEP